MTDLETIGTTISTIDSSVIVLDRQERVVLLNPSACAFLKLDSSAAGKTLMELKLDEALVAWLRGSIGTAYRDKRKTISFFGAEASEPGKLWKGTFSPPFPINGGRDVVVVSISEPKGAERLSAFPETENLLLNHPIWTTPSSHLIVTGNDLKIRFAGAASRKVGAKVGQSILDFDPPPSKELVGLFRSVRNDGESIMRLGISKSSATGEFSVVRLIVNPMPNPDGSNDVACFVVNVTSTEVGRLEPVARGILQERARLRTILGALPIGIEVTDLENGSIDRNSKLAMIWGASGQKPLPADFSECDVWRAESGEPLPKEEWPTLRALSTGCVSTENIEISKLDGGRAFTVVSSIPLKNHSGEVVGAITTTIDVTDLRELQLRAVTQARDLSRSNEELRHFAHVASHDLRQPLRAISGFMELLESEYGKTIGDDGRRYIERAIAGATKLHNVLDDLMKLYVIDTAKINFTRVNLGEPLKAALDQLDIAIKESGASITVEKLPTIKADETLMMSLLQNLLENSIKFRDPKRPLSIRVGAIKGKSEWTLTVEDNGIGFDPKYATKIFEAFERLHSSVDYQGTGIGLALCKKIAERHGGRIWCDSTPGVGSKFYVALPETNDFHAKRRRRSR